MSPREMGFRMPAEWEPQAGVWLSWPSHPANWPQNHLVLQALFAQIAATISKYENVYLNLPASQESQVLEQLLAAGAEPGHLSFYHHPTNDVWCRDHGPLFITNGDSLAVTDWGFNGWGEAFTPYDLDNHIPQCIAEALQIERFDPRMILEGGSIEMNSVGQLLTTEAVLLNPNRNPSLSRSEIEARLCDFLGAKEILWLQQGIEGDDTGGHIDDLARFVNDDTIVACVEKNPNAPNFQVLEDNLKRLRSFKTLTGAPFNIIEVPMPQPCQIPGWRLPLLPASYVNFLIINEAVLVPTFQQESLEVSILGLYQDLFPGRQIEPIPCLDLVMEGGALHCISQQQPQIF